MSHVVVETEYNNHVARSLRGGFKPLTFAQFSSLRYKILDCR